MTTRPFSKPRIDLAGAALVTMDGQRAAALGPAVAAIDPWARMGYAADVLTRFLASSDPAAHTFAVLSDGALAGGVTVRYPWLKGPYLEFLAVLPGFQGKGLGSAVLAWMEREAAAARERNLWVVCSAFNAAALAFYQRHGYRPAGRLPDLVHDGFEEILLRKFPLAANADAAR